jgi:hypothetical protein
MTEVCEIKNATPDLLQGFRFVQTINVPEGVIAIHPVDFGTILNRLVDSTEGFIDVYKTNLARELSSEIFTKEEENAAT